jgi:hypothetical protein
MVSLYPILLSQRRFLVKLFAALALTALLAVGSPIVNPASTNILPIPECYPCDDDIPLPDPPKPPGLPPCYPNCLVAK